MDPIPEVEEIREQLQKSHVQHVKTEISLARTFIDLGLTERDMGETAAHAKSMNHARQALRGARLGLDRIQGTEHQNDLKLEIDALDSELQTLEG